MRIDLDIIEDRMPRWNPQEKKLENPSMWNKALKFVKLGKVGYDGFNKVFIVYPIEGYNNTAYIIDPKEDLGCNCQGYNYKKDRGVEHPECSHRLAVILWIRKLKTEKKQLEEARAISGTQSLGGYME